MLPAKTLQERLAEAKKDSPLNEMTPARAAHIVTNTAKKGTSTGKVTKGAFKQGQEAWNKGKAVGKETWGKTRSERAKTMSEEERRSYFGVKEKHADESIEKMSAARKEYWSKKMKKVMADGVEYANIYEASSALGVHKDTIVYRIKSSGANWQQWYFIEEK